MWWLNWTIASKGHMQVPYNGKCTGIVLVLVLGRQQQRQPFSLSFSSPCSLPLSRSSSPPTKRVCLHAFIGAIACEAYTIFCVSSIGAFFIRIYNVRFTLHSSIREHRTTATTKTIPAASSRVIGFELRNGTHAAHTINF